MARLARGTAVGESRRPCGPRGAARARRGFTLAELIVTLAILATLAAFGLPALAGAVQRYRVDSAAAELASALRQAQGRAASQGGFFRVHLGTDPAVNLPNSYRIEREPGTGTNWPPPNATVQMNVGVVTDWVDLSRQYGPVTVSAPVDSAGRTLNWITYNNRGAFGDPTGPITPPATVTLTNPGGRTRTITVQFARAAKVQ